MKEYELYELAMEIFDECLELGLTRIAAKIQARQELELTSDEWNHLMKFPERESAAFRKQLADLTNDLSRLEFGISTGDGRDTGARLFPE